MKLLAKTYGHAVTAEDIAAYFYAVLAQPEFTARFHDELVTRELRVPLTANFGLFEHAAKLGRALLFLHTYGERFAQDQTWPAPEVKCLKAVPGDGLPEKFS